MDSILISLIVPVYNVKRYVSECIESLCRQTWQEIEIICVDDGSTDGSSELLKILSRLDTRVRLYRTDNHGVSHARNLGMQLAVGQVIMFVDADDILEPFACEEVARSFYSNKWDILKFSAVPFPEDAAEPWIIDTLTVPNRFETKVTDDLIFDRHSRPFVWNGAYRSEFLQSTGVHFPETLKLGEDQVFSFATLARSSRVIFSSDCLYRYRVARDDSAMSNSSCNIYEKISAHIEMLGLIMDDWIALRRMEGVSGRKMLEFCIDFIVPDLFNTTDVEQRVCLVEQMSLMLRQRVSKEHCFAVLGNSRLKKWFNALYDNTATPIFTAMLSKYRYYCDLLGFRSFIIIEFRKMLSGIYRKLCSIK